jgi:hypothetical protein
LTKRFYIFVSNSYFQCLSSNIMSLAPTSPNSSSLKKVSYCLPWFVMSLACSLLSPISAILSVVSLTQSLSSCFKMKESPSLFPSYSFIFSLSSTPSISVSRTPDRISVISSEFCLLIISPIFAN